MAEPTRWQDAWWHQQPDGTWLRFNDENQVWEPQPVQPQSVRPQPAHAPSQGMSTGAKWVIGLVIAFVGLLIVSILAAIAIPVFLNQREKGWASQVDEALRKAATAEEQYCVQATDQDRCYTESVDDLEATTGLTYSSDVELRVAVVDGSRRYCLEARHVMIDEDIRSYDSDVGRPVEGSCST